MSSSVFFLAEAITKGRNQISHFVIHNQLKDEVQCLDYEWSLQCGSLHTQSHSSVWAQLYIAGNKWGFLDSQESLVG